MARFLKAKFSTCGGKELRAAVSPDRERRSTQHDAQHMQVLELKDVPPKRHARWWKWRELYWQAQCIQLVLSCDRGSFGGGRGAQAVKFTFICCLHASVLLQVPNDKTIQSDNEYDQFEGHAATEPTDKLLSSFVQGVLVRAFKSWQASWRKCSRP